MKVAALGRTKFLLGAVRALRAAGHEIVLVGTCAAAPEYGVGVEEFRSLAEGMGAGFFNDPGINAPEILALLRNSGAEVAVSVNWPTVLQKEAIGVFPYGVLNSHFGDLPRYRGNACPNWAILMGESRLGLCIHLMEPEALDSGAVLIQEYLPLTDATTIGEIYAFAERRVPELFAVAVNGLATGRLTPIPQPQEPERALRCYPRIPSDSLIDWRQDAQTLCRLIRASSAPFAGAYTYLNGAKLIVWQARIDAHACPSLAVPGQVLWRDICNGETGVATGNDVLVLQAVSFAGAEPQSPARIIPSARTRLGMVMEDEIAALKQSLAELRQKCGQT